MASADSLLSQLACTFCKISLFHFKIEPESCLACLMYFLEKEAK